jgi:hypothetical protein
MDKSVSEWKSEMSETVRRQSKMGLWAAKGEELRQIAKVIQVANTRTLD